MKIKRIIIQNEGFVNCKSKFYSAHDVINYSTRYTFLPTINKLVGEIDSGNWAVSYLLSMYSHNPRDFVLSKDPVVTINDNIFSLNETSALSVYMDKAHPLFTKNNSIEKNILKGLKYSGLTNSSDEIRQIFEIDIERFKRPIQCVGNELFKAMAAIGFSYGKEIFCFPWLSFTRFEKYYKNLTIPLETLERFNKIIILPIGLPSTSYFNNIHNHYFR